MITIIKNGRLIDPKNNIDAVMDIAFENGAIKKVGESLSFAGAQVIDADGMWVTPGLIDMHVHLRDPGFKHKETIATGSRAAAAGGFTTICAMPNTSPITDNEVVVEYITSKAKKEAVVRVLPIGSITKGLEGETLSAIGEMAKAGICAISDDGKTVENPMLLKTAMKYAGMFSLPVLSHCEESRLAKGQINAGSHAELMGFKGISPESEELIVSRDIILAKSANAHLHICHVSTAGSLEYLRMAKTRGHKISAEVCPHHFSLCDEDIKDYDANFKMSPPLRSRADMKALKEALADGTIEVIATDHAPHHLDDKNCEFESAANGVVGLETAIAICITELVETDILTPAQLIEKLTVNPAGILGLKLGDLSAGSCADITIIDPGYEYVIDKNRFNSLGRNTPFQGRKVRGRAMYTIVGGKITLEKGELTC